MTHSGPAPMVSATPIIPAASSRSPTTTVVRSSVRCANACISGNAITANTGTGRPTRPASIGESPWPACWTSGSRNIRPNSPTPTISSATLPNENERTRVSTGSRIAGAPRRTCTRWVIAKAANRVAAMAHATSTPWTIANVTAVRAPLTRTVPTTSGRRASARGATSGTSRTTPTNASGPTIRFTPNAQRQSARSAITAPSSGPSGAGRGERRAVQREGRAAGVRSTRR